eukprot:scaffold849_cov386-Prasinococcus_capsulatus_cf.AAC.5
MLAMSPSLPDAVGCMIVKPSSKSPSPVAGTECEASGSSAPCATVPLTSPSPDSMLSLASGRVPVASHRSSAASESSMPFWAKAISFMARAKSSRSSTCCPFLDRARSQTSARVRFSSPLLRKNETAAAPLTPTSLSRARSNHS